MTARLQLSTSASPEAFILERPQHARAEAQPAIQELLAFRLEADVVAPELAALPGPWVGWYRGEVASGEELVFPRGPRVEPAELAAAVGRLVEGARALGLHQFCAALSGLERDCAEVRRRAGSKGQ